MADSARLNEALSLIARLAKKLGELEARLKALEQVVREPRGAKPKGGELSDGEWLAQRRLIMAENAKHRWPKKRKKAPKR